MTTTREMCPDCGTSAQPCPKCQSSPSSGSSGASSSGGGWRRIQPTTPDFVGNLLGSTIAGRYQLERVLGMGGMGVVYEAKDAQSGGVVAVKVLHERLARSKIAAQRFRREAEITSRIDNPHLCKILDFGALEDGRPFLCMPRLRGETLAERKASGHLSYVDAADVMIAVLSALAVAHERGIVHRDVKSGNIFLSYVKKKLEIKVLDFGVGKLLHNMSPDLTPHGVVVGTPLYFSPELVRGACELSAQIDLWACGVLLYELITGSMPFSGQTRPELMKAIAKTVYPAPTLLRPTTPPSMAKVIAIALDRAPEKRFPTAKHFRDTLMHLRRDFVRATAEDARARARRTPLVEPEAGQLPRLYSTAAGAPSSSRVPIMRVRVPANEPLRGIMVPSVPRAMIAEPEIECDDEATTRKLDVDRPPRT